VALDAGDHVEDLQPARNTGMSFITPSAQAQIEEAINEAAESSLVALFDEQTRTGIAVWIDWSTGTQRLGAWRIVGPMPADQFDDWVRTIADELGGGAAGG
jgi:hypothetical protein